MVNAQRVDVADGVRIAITNGDFVAGQRLVEADLCEQFEASRASVRSALLQLTNEGLVERVPNRGARVRIVPLAEAVEISEVRMVLEGLCAAKAAAVVQNGEIDELQRIGTDMRAAVAVGDTFGYSRLNQLLHQRVREMSGQKTAATVLERLRFQSVKHQFRLAAQPGRPGISLPEHLAIIDGLCSRDPAAAEAAMRGHVASVIEAMRAFEYEPATGNCSIRG